jgi:hypothetical protein
MSKRQRLNWFQAAIATWVWPACLATVLLAGCRGGPCSNCGYGGYPAGYGQPYAPTTVAPTMPQGTVIQPGYQYAPGTVPVAPQQLPPGAIYGG